jgi:hypothetical protein
MRLPVLALGVLAFTACATSLEDIRGQFPARTGDFPQPYQALARCIYDRLDAQMEQGYPAAPSAAPFAPGVSSLRYYLDDRAEQRRARVSAMTGGLPSRGVFEITVESTAAGSSHVEYRRQGLVSPYLDADAWVIVAACGEAG